MLLLGEGESSTVSTKQGELRWQCLSSAGVGCGGGVWGSQRDESGWTCSKSAVHVWNSRGTNKNDHLELCKNNLHLFWSFKLTQFLCWSSCFWGQSQPELCSPRSHFRSLLWVSGFSVAGLHIGSEPGSALPIGKDVFYFIGRENICHLTYECT